MRYFPPTISPSPGMPANAARSIVPVYRATRAGAAVLKGRMIRVFLADDHQMFRDGVRRILDHVEDIQVVGEASDGDAVLTEAAKTTWDVLVLDLNMPGAGGVEVLRRLRASHPRLAILVL